MTSFLSEQKKGSLVASLPFLSVLLWGTKRERVRNFSVHFPNSGAESQRKPSSRAVWPLLLYFSPEEYECKSELASGRWWSNCTDATVAQETDAGWEFADWSPLLPSFPDLVLTLIHHPHCLYLLLLPPPECTCKGACLLLFPLPAQCMLGASASGNNPIVLAPYPRMTCANRPSLPPTVYQT